MWCNSIKKTILIIVGKEIKRRKKLKKRNKINKKKEKREKESKIKLNTTCTKS